MKDVNLVYVKFPAASRMYLFKALKSLGLVNGDDVVVRSSTGLGIGRIEAHAVKSDHNLEQATAWVIQKVDETEVNAAKHRETQLEHMRTEIERQRKILQDEAVYEAIAAKNPEFNLLIQQFKAMGGSLGE